MVEYFTQVNPRWPDTHRRLVSTDCPECLIDIHGHRDPDGDPHYSDITIGLLSSHVSLREATLWGRLRLAWAILRGQYSETLYFTRSEQVHAFTTHLLDISHRVFDPPTVPPEA